MRLDGRLQGLQLGRQLGAEGRQVVGVQGHTLEFHVHEHGEQRHFHVPVQRLQLAVGQFGQQHLGELEGDVGVFARVVDHFRWRQVGHAFLVLALLAQQRRDGDALVAEERLGEGVHAMRLIGLEQVVGHHGVLKAGACEVHPVARHDFAVVLEVLTHDGRAGRLQQRLEHRPNVWPRLCVDRHVGGHAGFVAEGHAHQIGGHGVQPCGLGVEGEAPGLGQRFDQLGPRGRGVRQRVVHLRLVQGRQGGDGGGHFHGGVEHAQLAFGIVAACRCGGGCRRGLGRRGDWRGRVAQKSA